MNQLLPIEEVNAVEVYTGDGLDELLDQISAEVIDFVPDLTTDKGRKAIASIAAKVAKSKTYLDGVGKELVSDWKSKSKVVDNKRKAMRERLDSLKESVRKPLTDWENEEKERVEAIETSINEISLMGSGCLEQWMDLSLDEMRELFANIDSRTDFEEYQVRADEVKEAAISRINQAIEKRETYDKEQAELETLRAQAAEREQKDRDERIAKEATEKAERETRENAQKEIDRVERERQEALDAVAAGELREKEAAEQKERDIEAAKQAERDRIAAEKKADEEAAEKREKNKRHKAKINNAIIDSMVGLAGIGLDIPTSKAIITAIAKGDIPNVRISY